MTSLDSTEKAFVDCLKEIKASYLEFNKPLRLRIEKWVEKLSLSSNKNLTWRRHRNAYAKLLLGMIVAKELSDPFHTMPPDGPLPSFPAQHNHKFKSMLGSHESSFWRELFRNIQDNNSGVDGNNINNNDEYDVAMGSIMLSRAENQRISEIMNRRPMSPSRPINREIQTLTSLIKEQQARIQLLEQQLRDERLQHEIQIQRLQYAHRIEVASVRDTSAFNSTLDRTATAHAAATVVKEAEQRQHWPSNPLRNSNDDGNILSSRMGWNESGIGVNHFTGEASSRQQHQSRQPDINPNRRSSGSGGGGSFAASMFQNNNNNNNNNNTFNNNVDVNASSVSLLNSTTGNFGEMEEEQVESSSQLAATLKWPTTTAAKPSTAGGASGLPIPPSSSRSAMSWGTTAPSASASTSASTSVPRSAPASATAAALAPAPASLMQNHHHPPHQRPSLLTRNNQPALPPPSSDDAFLSFLKSDQKAGSGAGDIPLDSTFREVKPVTAVNEDDDEGSNNGTGTGMGAVVDDDYMAYLERFQAEIRTLK